jgi:hypothetical protein
VRLSWCKAGAFVEIYGPTSLARLHILVRPATHFIKYLREYAVHSDTTQPRLSNNHSDFDSSRSL